MIEEHALVTAIEKDLVTLQLQRRSACDACQLNAGCGTGSLGRLLGFRPRPLTIRTQLELKPGDQVLVALEERAFLVAGGLVYLLPLAGLFLFAIFADLVLGLTDGSVVAAALVGLFAGFRVSGWLSQRVFQRSMNPRVVRRIIAGGLA